MIYYKGDKKVYFPVGIGFLKRPIWQRLMKTIVDIAWYGNTGCTGDTKLVIFLPKNQHTQRKLLNFENWPNGGVSKSAII